MSDEDVLIRRDELHFLLFDWLSALEDRDVAAATLDVATKLAADAFVPCHAKSDAIEPVLEGGAVKVLPEFGEALQQYVDLGLFSAGFEEELGGLGLSRLTCVALYAQFAAANISAAGFAMLTNANSRVIAAFGTPAQVDAFARPQIAGRWFGTMCLSEPQAGSSLGDIRARADPDGEDALGGRFRIAGNKMWISGADQDLSENIVHLVLAKEPGPDGALIAGTAGISLFIVPKVLPEGTHNDIAIAGLNHKLGYRGVPNCLVNFGESGGALGWRIGEAGHGLKYMFEMMNEARIMVGTGAAALAYRGYMQALRYARERTQGRPIGVRSGAPVPIIAHPDVKAMLLRQKVYAEGALALCLYSADLFDRDDEAARELLGLLTPVTKSWPSEFGLIANDLAIQVHGGYGYTRDFDVERLWRDNRLNAIHEGTTGIQALDLLGRKLLLSDGHAFELLVSRVAQTASRASTSPALGRHAADLQTFFADIGSALIVLGDADPQRAFEDATWFLRAFGHGVVAWLWLDMALAATALGEGDFHLGKVSACHFFFGSELPQARAWLGIVKNQEGIHAAMSEAEF